MQTITRKGSFDSMHRVMNEKMKCFNVHGHTYIYEVSFSFNQIESIGYAIDFKEIKRIACQWIDDVLDHGAILNPQDERMIKTCMMLESKMWLMSLNGTEYCNPTVENISKELFMAMEILFEHVTGLTMHYLRLYETPNCFCDTWESSISDFEQKNFYTMKRSSIRDYADAKGELNYDDRK